MADRYTKHLDYTYASEAHISDLSNINDLDQLTLLLRQLNAIEEQIDASTDNSIKLDML